MKRLVFVLALAAAAVAGCGPENTLGGSLSEVFPLDVSRIEVYRNEEALQVTYYRNRNVFLDVVARVSVALKQCDAGVDLDGGAVTSCSYIDPKPGTRIDLSGEYEPGHPRTTVAHAPGGEPVRLLPRVKRGDMNISAGGPPETVTRGNFSVLFEAEGGDLGFGRTLYGNFAGLAVDGGFGPLP